MIIEPHQLQDKGTSRANLRPARQKVTPDLQWLSNHINRQLQEHMLAAPSGCLLISS